MVNVALNSQANLRIVVDSYLLRKECGLRRRIFGGQASQMTPNLWYTSENFIFGDSVFVIWLVYFYYLTINVKFSCCIHTRGADKSLARPGRKQAWKHVRNARDVNKIETRAVIKFLFLQSKAPKEIHAILTETLVFSPFLVGPRIYQHYCMWPLATEMQDLRNITNLPEGMAVGSILNCCYYF